MLSNDTNQTVHPLNRLLDKDALSILGLMSGTSCDGLDIALVAFTGSGPDTRFEFQTGLNLPYTPEQRASILGLINQHTHTLKDLSQLNFYLAGIWADMIQDFLEQNNLKPENIDLIGSHGQTIWHEPVSSDFLGRSVVSTWQTGDPAVLAQRLGIPVVGEFRYADVALGGQGAPLIPYFDWVHFSQFSENILAVNIGGISNITFIPADGDFSHVIAFDTGPGNMLIDQAAKQFFDREYDEDGRLAREGSVDTDLLDFLKNNDSFLNRVPPKSTGREYYGASFMKRIGEFAGQHAIGANSLVATLTRYTAYAIYTNYRQFIAPENPCERVAIGGGGAHNPALMDELRKLFKTIPVEPVSRFNINEDFKEAIGFALLANETIHAGPSNVPRVTGASRPAILGKICLV